MYRLGAQGANPTALWKFYVQSRSETAVQRGDIFFVAADEAAYKRRALWSSPVPGDMGDRRTFPGHIVRKAGSPRAVRPVEQVPLFLTMGCTEY